MEWSAKWDWESIAKLSSKACESPKKLQLTDWGIVEEEGEIVNGSFNLSGGYASDVGQGSTHSSPGGATGAKEAIFPFVDVKMENCREACIGLKLGKRTYFENNNCSGGGGSGGKTKKPSSCQGGTAVPRCQVEGCNIDLSSGKEYHRKHRVCESHSKYPKVIVGGLERRFCQQCSRFHSLGEFDEKKRSCRRRLCDHNARRRKPQNDAFQLNTSANRLSPSFYDGRQQINFMMNNNVPLFGTSKTASNSSCWDNSNTYASNKFIVTRGFSPEAEKPSRTNKQQQPYISSGIHPPNATIGFHDSYASNDTLLDSKGPTSDGFTQGVKGSMFYMETSMTTEEFPARALSLLSTSSWSSSCEQQQQQQDSTSISQSAANQTALHEQPSIPLGLPLPSPEYWSCVEPAGGHLPVDVHLEFKVSQEGDFFLNSFS
ncbi:unnamed protein product [Cuscuta campestris]|uniref:SBP-type domain-containing protein n=1 Tax=Cuscuta campestris TaxID=132261 RepID=A0A484LWZ9_9ASTE|nr:unnamed protein product [Cuscuta campestris]